jgi:WD40 repeat protein
VRIWDIATGRERAVLKGHTDTVSAVAVAPDGSRLASAGQDRSVRIWEVASGQPCALIRVENDLLACAWLGMNALAAGGFAGLYLFDFLTDASPA